MSAPRQRGSVLVAVAFLAALLGILSVSMMLLMSADTEEVYNHLKHTRALAVAEAGIEHAIQMLRSNASWQTGFSNQVFPAGSGNTYSVTVDNSAFPQVKLVSTSQVDGFARKMEVEVLVDGPPTPQPYPVLISSWREP